MARTNDYLAGIDKLIGKKIYLLRRQKNIRRVELAEKIDVSPQQIEKYENAKNKISASRLGLVAKVLDENISSFYEMSKPVSK